MPLTEPSTVRPPAPGLACDFCHLPADSVTVRAVPGDPASKRVALGHDACYREFMDGLPRRAVSDPPSRIEPGRCECGRWSEYCRVVAEIDGDSGPGYVVLCCPVCDLEPAPRPRRASDPRRYPG
jgi:hypothetical protein